MARKFDFNGTHVPPPYMERSFNGTENMISRTSAREAPDVSTYDYNNVENATSLEHMMVDFDMVGVDQNSTSLNEHYQGKNIDNYALLNDAWFCVILNDGGKLYSILNTLVKQGIECPADHPFTTMFGTTTLWDKIHDMELKIPEKIRNDTIKLLSMYHSDKGRPAAATGSGSAPL